MISMILYFIRKYSLLTIIAIYFLIEIGYVVDPTYTSILSILTIVSLYHVIDIRGIYTTPDIMGIIVLETMILTKTLF